MALLSDYEWRGATLVDLVHTGGRGMVAFSVLGPNGWQDTLVPAREAVARSVELEGEVDQFFSVAQYRRRRRSSGYVQSFSAIAVDLDMLGADPEVLRAEVLAFMRTAGIPEPSAIVDSGMKGLHLWWALVGRIPPQADRRRRAVASGLVDKLKRFGADPACVDGARMMRLPGSIHGKTGRECRIVHWTGEKVDFEDVFAAAVPFGRAELARRREQWQQRRRKQRRNRPSEQTNAYPKRILAALDALARLRGGGFCEGKRNHAVIIAAAMFATYLTGTELEAAVVAFGRRTTDLPDSVHRSTVRSAGRQRHTDGTGYRYKLATIRRRLAISPAEAAELGLFGDEQARRGRDAERKRRERRKAGARPQAMSRARAKPSVPMGISQSTYYRRLRSRRVIRTNMQEALKRLTAIRPHHTSGVAPNWPAPFSLTALASIKGLRNLLTQRVRARSPPSPG